MKQGCALIGTDNIYGDECDVINGELYELNGWTGNHVLHVTRLFDGYQMDIKRTTYDGGDKGYAQFPVNIAYAMTFYKCQGQKFNGVVIDLHQASMVRGCFLTACSRVTKLENIIMAGDGSRDLNDLLVACGIESYVASDRQVQDYEHFSRISN